MKSLDFPDLAPCIGMGLRGSASKFAFGLNKYVVKRSDSPLLEGKRSHFQLEIFEFSLRGTPREKNALSGFMWLAATGGQAPTTPSQLQRTANESNSFHQVIQATLKTASDELYPPKPT